MPEAITQRPSPDEYNEYYGRYVSRVPAGNLLSIYEQQAAEVDRVFRGLNADRAGFSYAPGKWTVRESLGHVIDTERVFSYRAVAFARADPNPLPSFEQDVWMPQAGFEARPIAGLVDEFLAVRQATIALARGLPEDALMRRGVASGNPITVRALLCLSAGHLAYHLEILRDRYQVS